jgi:hypothetical protein
MGKVILVASIILIACSTGEAFAARLHRHWSAAMAAQAQWQSAVPDRGPHYHGGPKSNF